MKRVLSTVEEEASLLLNLSTVVEEQRLFDDYDEKLKTYQAALADLVDARTTLWNQVMPYHQNNIPREYCAHIMKRMNSYGRAVLSNIVYVTDKTWSIDSFCINQSIFIQRTSYWHYTLTYEGVPYKCTVGGGRHFPDIKSMENVFTLDVDWMVTNMFFAMDRQLSLVMETTQRIMDATLLKKRKQ